MAIDNRDIDKEVLERLEQLHLATQKRKLKEREYQVRLIADAVVLALEEFGAARQTTWRGGPR